MIMKLANEQWIPVEFAVHATWTGVNYVLTTFLARGEL